MSDSGCSNELSLSRSSCDYDADLEFLTEPDETDYSPKKIPKLTSNQIDSTVTDGVRHHDKSIKLDEEYFFNDIGNTLADQNLVKRRRGRPKKRKPKPKPSLVESGSASNMDEDGSIQHLLDAEKKINEQELLLSTYKDEIQALKNQLKSCTAALTDNHNFEISRIKQYHREHILKQQEIYHSKIKVIIERPILTILGLIPEFSSMTMNSPIELRATDTRDKNTLYWMGVHNFSAIWKQVSRYFSAGRRGPPRLYGDAQLFGMFLLWMRQGFSYEHMAKISGTDESVIRVHFRRIAIALQPWVLEQVYFPDIPAWISQTSEKFRSIEIFKNHVMFFVDGTILKCFSPINPPLRRARWNPKHKTAARAFSILVTEKGEIVWVSEIMSGKVHDRDAWNNSGVAQELRKKYGTQYPQKKPTIDNPILSVGGDKGYPHIVLPQGWKLYVTKTAITELQANPMAQMDDNELVSQSESTSSEISSEQNSATDSSDEHKNFDHLPNSDNRIFTKELAQFRSVVERSFRDVKCWQILGNRYFTSSKRSRLHRVVRIICAIVNWNKRISE